jgi:hypothetical protein
MKRPSLELLSYGLILVLGGGIMLARLPATQQRFQTLTGVFSVLLVGIGVSLLLRYRWSPELFIGLMVSVLAWAVANIAHEGLSHSGLMMILGATAAICGYPALCRQVRRARVRPGPQR